MKNLWISRNKENVVDMDMVAAVVSNVPTAPSGKDVKYTTNVWFSGNQGLSTFRFDGDDAVSFYNTYISKGVTVIWD
jgi:hypothetical protein